MLFLCRMCVCVSTQPEVAEEEVAAKVREDIERLFSGAGSALHEAT